MTFVADGPAPPVQANMNRLKVLFSTLIRRDPYLSFFCFSWNVYASLISFGHDLAGGEKTFTSKRIWRKRKSGIPLALMSVLLPLQLTWFCVQRTRLVTAEASTRFRHQNRPPSRWRRRFLGFHPDAFVYNLPCGPRGLYRTVGKRPDGVTMIPWEMGKQLVWDVTVVDALAPSRQNQGSLCNRGTTISEDEARNLMTSSFEFR